MRKDAQAVLLLLIGGTLLKISFTGTYVRYVKTGQLPLLVIAGVALVAIAGVTLWYVIRAPRVEPDHGPEPTDDETPGFGDLGAETLSRQADSRQTGSRQADSRQAESRQADQPVEVAPRLSDLREPTGGHASLAPLMSTTPLALTTPLASTPFESTLPALSAGPFAPGPPAEAVAAAVGSPAEAQQVTYREFTPGELVAMPAGHQYVARERAAQAAVAHDQTAVFEVVRDEPVEVHVHSEPRIAWLLLLPALALLLFAPPALGSYQATRNGTALSARADSDFPPLPAGEPLRISMLDYAGRAVFDQGRSLQGRRIVLSGFVIAGPNGQPYLARMIVTCCAADARPVKVGLAGDLPTALQPDQWIEVEGSFLDRADKDPVNAELVPYIQVTTIHDIAAPEQQYES